MPEIQWSNEMNVPDTLVPNIFVQIIVVIIMVVLDRDRCVDECAVNTPKLADSPSRSVLVC